MLSLICIITIFFVIDIIECRIFNYVKQIVLFTQRSSFFITTFRVFRVVNIRYGFA